MVYVTIVGLQAFYVSDTSEIQTMMDYRGQDLTAKGHHADEMRNITEAQQNYGLRDDRRFAGVLRQRHVGDPNDDGLRRPRPDRQGPQGRRDAQHHRSSGE